MPRVAVDTHTVGCNHPEHSRDEEICERPDHRHEEGRVVVDAGPRLERFHKGLALGDCAGRDVGMVYLEHTGLRIRVNGWRRRDVFGLAFVG